MILIKKYNKKNHQNINEIRKIIKDHPAPGKVKNFVRYISYNSSWRSSNDS